MGSIVRFCVVIPEVGDDVRQGKWQTEGKLGPGIVHVREGPC